MDALRVSPAQVCAWVDDGTLRSMEAPGGTWVRVEDVLEVERGRVHERLVREAAGRVA